MNRKVKNKKQKKVYKLIANSSKDVHFTENKINEVIIGIFKIFMNGFESFRDHDLGMSFRGIEKVGGFAISCYSFVEGE